MLRGEDGSACEDDGRRVPGRLESVLAGVVMDGVSAHLESDPGRGGYGDRGTSVSTSASTGGASHSDTQVTIHRAKAEEQASTTIPRPRGNARVASGAPTRAGSIHPVSRRTSGFAQVRSETGASRVELVGHSQGGLVERQFVKTEGGAAVVASRGNLRHVGDRSVLVIGQPEATEVEVASMS